MPQVQLDVRLPQLRVFQREPGGAVYYAAPAYLPSSAAEPGPRCPVTGWYVVGPEAGMGYLGCVAVAAEYMAGYLQAEMPGR